MIPPVPTLKEKLRQTGLRYHVENEEKKLGVTKLNLAKKESFLPKIEQKGTQAEVGSAQKKRRVIQEPQTERPPSQDRQMLRGNSSQRELRKGGSLKKLNR